MEIGKVSTSMAKKKSKLAIEEYLDFIDDRTLNLPVQQLRQIIAMHGFKKIEAPKTTLKDIVGTMELMDLHRSTLVDGVVSGDACLTLGEVINDLKNLEWQECHVTSLLTQRAANSSPSATRDGAVPAKQKRSKGSKRKRVKAAGDKSVISTSGTTLAAGSTTEASVSCDCSKF